jgi:zinc/manganese transport system substrate-binding protein
VHELAGDKVDLSVGTSALQDVHQIEAKPSLIAKVRQADLIVCTGAELEVGWLPQLIRQSGNARVASGPGYFMATDQVKTLERPTALDRANGDVHPQGNPHIQLDPYRVLKIAKALDARLASARPGRTRRPTSNASRRLHHALAGRDQALGSQGRTAEGQEGRRAPHQLGVPQHVARPAADRRARTQARRAADQRTSVEPDRHDEGQGTYAIISAAYQDPKPARWLSDRTGVFRGRAAVHRRRRCAVEGPVRPVRLHHRQAAGCRQMNFDGRLDMSILGPACVAGPDRVVHARAAGRQVLSRGIIFIDLAIAQIAALGVILAQYLGIDEHGFGVEIAAALAALAGAGLLAWTDGAGRNCRSR